MRGSDLDAVIVGARCAGAPLAAFLARSGARVLLLDRSPMPSDQVLSTHTIHPPGVAVLDELGVGEDVREVAPTTRRIRLAKGDAWADMKLEPGRMELCPRRERLDGLLQQAAVEAGAELRDRTRVTDVLFDDGRAVGVRARSDGGSEEIRADLVVGADGRHSTVAEEVEAEEYMVYDAPRAMYWGYWDAPDAWRSEAYPFDMYLSHRDEHYRAIFQTDHDQLLVGSLPPVEEGRSWRDDPLGRLRESLLADPVTGSLVGDADPDGKIRGTVKERYFFRRAAGSGWALVGDAGHHKDFVIGDGITEALLQAKSLARAIAGSLADGEAVEADETGGAATDADGLDAALERWWRARDVEALPQYFWGKDEGGLGPPGTLETQVIRAVASDPGLQRRMTGLPEHRLSPYEVVPPGVALRCALGELARGRWDVVPELVAQIRDSVTYERELKKRKDLLEEAEAETRAPAAAGG